MHHDYYTEDEYYWLEDEYQEGDFSYTVVELPAPIDWDGGCFSQLVIPLIVVFIGGLFAMLYLLFNPVPDELGEQAIASVSKSFEELAAPESELAPIFTPEVMHWKGEILAWADQWGLDPNMVATVMQIESCGDPMAVSNAGATGLFQVMPYHFTPDENPYLPDINAARGLAYLQRALEENQGDTRLAFAGYNGGITGTQRSEIFWPDETVRYAYWGENIFREALAGENISNTLEEWLLSGGASLCRQAHSRLGLEP